MLKFRSLVSAWLLCSLLFVSCDSQPLEAPGLEQGRGKVTDFNIEPNLRVALINELELKDNTTPELNYGAMDTHFVTIDDVTYMVEWNDLDDFKNLKQNEEISFKSASYLARVEKTGKTYRVIRLHEF
jgi:hypothetical protein